MKRDILSILDLSKEELNFVLSFASELKTLRKNGYFPDLLNKKTLGMIFEKASTRTRVSFEVGMFELGGHALFLNPQDMQLGRGEEIRDTARVLSRFLSALMIRAYKHSTIVEMAKYSTIPVINGLSDLEHPCQIIADIQTMKEHFGSVKNLNVAWIGDGNNVCNSLILSSALTGYNVNVAAPKGYLPPEGIIEMAESAGAKFTFCNNPEEAVSDADVIYTDTWVSMGSESDETDRLCDFRGYTVNDELLKNASSGAVVMHCLPAHRGDEITDSVMEGSQSVIWDQAENRLHAQKALLVMLLGNRDDASVP